jgi:hypothetical protein
MSICPSVSPHAGPQDRVHNTHIWRHHIGALDCHPTAPIGGSVRVLPSPCITGCNAAYRGSPLPAVDSVRCDCSGGAEHQISKRERPAWAPLFRWCGG